MATIKKLVLSNDEQPTLEQDHAGRKMLKGSKEISSTEMQKKKIF